MSATRGVAITAIGNFLPPAVMLVTQALLAQRLGVEGRGGVAAATAPLMLAVAVFTLGLPETLTYYFATGGRRFNQAFSNSLAALAVAGFAGTGLIAVLAQSLSAGSAELAHLMIVAAFALPPALLTAALRGVAYGAHLWWLVTAERAFSALLQLSMVAGLFATGSLTLASGTLTIAAATFVGALVYLVTPRFRRLLLRTDAESAQKDSPSSSLASYAWRIWTGSVAGIILVRLDQVMMTPLAGVAQLGIYVVAVNVSNVTLLFNSAVGQVLFALEPGEPNAARVGRAARISTLVTGIVGVALCALSPWMVPLLFGPGFARAVPVIVILVLSYCLANPGSVAGAVLSARGRPGQRSLSMVIATILYLAAMFSLVPRYGAIGAAAAMVFATVIPGYLNIFLLKRYCGVPFSEFYKFRKSDLDVFIHAWRWLAGRGRANARVARDHTSDSIRPEIE